MFGPLEESLDIGAMLPDRQQAHDGGEDDQGRGLLAEPGGRGKGKRRRERQAGRTLTGPHRDELVVTMAGKMMPAADCSTGEQKAMLIALTLAHATLAGRGRPGVLPVGDLELDPAAQSVVLSGNTVDLTAKEFAVLHFLVRQPGVVVSKTQIVENVWDVEFDGDLNIVEVYVRSIRKKIGADRIETVRGAGYRFQDSIT